MIGGGSAGFKDHFSDCAGAYAAHRPTYPVALVNFLAALVPHSDLAWDVGCGSGQLSVLLAERFSKVIGTDASAEQIGRATPHPRVEYRQALAENSGLADRSVDLVAAAQAAHWFDLPRFYVEVRRVARPGSVIALVAYGRMDVDVTINPVIEHFYSEVLGPYWPPERQQVENRYRFLPFPFPEIHSSALEMRAEWTLTDLLGYVETWSAVRALERAKGSGRTEAFRRELVEKWGAESAKRAVRWPLALRVGRV